MTEVLCTFDECNYYKPHDENYGICTKDHITLDEAVSGRTCGCPDAEWDEPKEEGECDLCEWWENDTGFCWSKADSDDHACHFKQKDKPQANLALPSDSEAHKYNVRLAIEEERLKL